MEAIARLELAAAESDLELRFATFVEAHRERARRLAWRLVGGDDAAADDVAQDAFVRAWLGLARFRGEASLGTWFYRILVRQAAQHRRWRRLRELWGASERPTRRIRCRAGTATRPCARASALRWRACRGGSARCSCWSISRSSR